MPRTHEHYDVNGRTVFITGAARGIGAATAKRLYAKGANVALVGLEPELLEQNAAGLGDRAAVFAADVTDLGELEHAVSGAVARFGAIDVAIANAGVSFTGSLASAPVEQVERTMAVNYLGVWRTDRAVIGQIMERRGYLLNISSLSTIANAPMMGPYASTKAAVEVLSNILRMETMPSGARVGCAYFGFIDTDLVRASFALPSTQLLQSSSPGFISKPAPLSKAIDAIELGVERRSARVWAPRWLGPMLLARGLIQPLIERSVAKDPAQLTEALRMADSSEETEGMDPLLGVARGAVEERLTRRG
jgi:NAD(P)-dependent dehydrogenase (short-subunit alcohol dehydrogenase family)